MNRLELYYQKLESKLIMGIPEATRCALIRIEFLEDIEIDVRTLFDVISMGECIISFDVYIDCINIAYPSTILAGGYIDIPIRNLEIGYMNNLWAVSTPPTPNIVGLYGTHAKYHGHPVRVYLYHNEEPRFDLASDFQANVEYSPMFLMTTLLFNLSIGNNGYNLAHLVRYPVHIIDFLDMNPHDGITFIHLGNGVINLHASEAGEYCLTFRYNHRNNL